MRRFFVEQFVADRAFMEGEARIISVAFCACSAN